MGGGDEGGDKTLASDCVLSRGDGGPEDSVAKERRDRVGDMRGRDAELNEAASSGSRGGSGRGMLGGLLASGNCAKDSIGTGFSFGRNPGPRRFSTETFRAGVVTLLVS